MALKSPLMPSPTGGLSSKFSPFDSPDSPAAFGSLMSYQKRSSEPSDHLAVPASPYPPGIEPSPTDSNGTETTDIEEDAQEGVKSPGPTAAEDRQSQESDITSPQSAASDLVPKLDTKLPTSSASDDEPQSVIHVPPGFKTMDDVTTNLSPAVRCDNTIVSPSTPEAITSPIDKKPSSPSPVNTNDPQYLDRTTPRAQTRQDVDDERKRRSRRASSLEDIEETDAPDRDDNEGDRPSTAGLAGDITMTRAMHDNLNDADQEIAALRTALSECWTFCNTLAGLSYSHRKRTFRHAGREEVPEQAWQSCWRLCQKLYESWDEDHPSQVVPTLELYRDFCQSLFEARQRLDEVSDSVLRVSFELNNHLYNNQDGHLPSVFTERTLDFYKTLCHRLMKQPTSLPDETDTLLRACWALAEKLSNLRQSSGEGTTPEEDLLGSAIQACWELCDLFRAGWTKIRPDRGTPRPTQATFPPISQPPSFQTTTSSRSNSSLSNRQHPGFGRGLPPETPTTIIDDTSTAASSPVSATLPAMIVLGPASTGSAPVRGGAHHPHDGWDDNASAMSFYSASASSQRTSSTQRSASTATNRTKDLEDLIRYLLLKAGMDAGYSKVSGQNLPSYVKALPRTTFGVQPWQEKVFEEYRQFVLSRTAMFSMHDRSTRNITAVEMAKAVDWLAAKESFAWVRDLYRIVFKVGIEDAARWGGNIQV